jgi:oligopeptide/dipeptide ABC transporter ATP-binding protein
MLLQIHELRKHFRLGRNQVVRAVDGVSLELAEGTVMGLVGESGSGKSTLGKTAIGLLDKTGGQVRYRGKVLPARYRARDFRQQLGEIQMIFQDPYSSLNPRLTVREIIAEPLTFALSSGDSAREARITASLARVGLSPDHLGRYPHELSGGQRQRVGIARALILQPRVVICDEPVSALDVSVQAQVVNLLLDLQQSMALTLLLIAHDLALVRHLSDRIAVMYLGSLMEEGPTDDVYGAPAHPYTQALIAARPEPDPRREHRRTRIPIHGEITGAPDRPSGCCFAPRCPRVVERCRHEVPQLRPLGGSRSVACHLAQ